MAVAFGNNGVGDVTPGTSFTIAITIGSGANRAVFATVMILQQNIDVSSITGGGGGTWTQINGFVNTGGADGRTSLWYSTNPTSGAQTLTVNLSASGSASGVAVEASGVDQTTVVGTAGTGSGVSTAPTANAAGVVSGDGTISGGGASGIAGGETYTVNGANDVKDNSHENAGVQVAAFFGHNVTDTGTVTEAWTISASRKWAEIAVRVIAAAVAVADGGLSTYPIRVRLRQF